MNQGDIVQPDLTQFPETTQFTENSRLRIVKVRTQRVCRICRKVVHPGELYAQATELSSSVCLDHVKEVTC